MTFMELAQARYSVRAYADRDVEPEKLNAVLEAANVAPTAKNLQPQRIYVLQSDEALKKIDALTRCRFGAPVVLVFAYDTDEEWQNPLESGVRSGVEDVSIAATHAMLEAAELGLGTCWVNYFPNSALEKSLALPANERAVLIMPLGYPAAEAAPSPNHEKCKPLAATVKYL